MDPQGQFTATLIRSAPRAYASGVIARMEEKLPGLLETMPLGILSDPLQDTEVRLLHVAEALATARPALLAHQIDWYKVAFAARGVPAEYLPTNLECLAAELVEALPADAHPRVAECLSVATERLRRAPDEVASLLADDAPMVDTARRFLLAILETRGDDAVALIERSLSDGAELADVYTHVLAKTLAEMGRMWQMGEIHIGEEHYGSRVIERVLGLVSARVGGVEKNGRRVLTLSVGGNLHDFGIRMVADHFAMAGWEPIHLGANMPAADVAMAVQDFGADLVAVSATLVLHVSATAELIGTLQAALGDRRVPLLVGGGPFRIVPDLWHVVGADACAVDAAEAVRVANQL